MNIESRIRALENENAARKVIYPVAASLVDFVLQVSQIFHIRGGDNSIIDVVIKFIPDIKPKDGPLFVDLFPQVSANADFSTQFPKMTFYQLPQVDGEAAVMLGIVVPDMEVDLYIRVIATGSVRGKFTKV